MGYKKLAVILFILIVFSFGTFIFYQRSRDFTKIRPEEPGQLYVLEMPPQSRYLTNSASERFYEALQPEAGIIVQNPKNILPGLLQFFDVQYVFLREKKYWELFAPFLEYSSIEEKNDLPRTFPVKKEALNSSSEPFLILGEGWHSLGKDAYGIAERGFGKEAIIRYVVSPGALSRAPDILTFSITGSPLPGKGKKAVIEVLVNGKQVYISDSFGWAITKLNYLQEGVNEIKLRSPGGCVVPEEEGCCFSFIIQQIELLSSKDIPLEGLLRLDHRFIEIKEGQYWTEQHAALRVFTLFPNPSLVTFQIQAAGGEPRLISVIEKDKEIERIIIYGKESQEIGLLTYRQGENVFYLSADGCGGQIIEGEKRCIAAQIKDLEIKFAE